MHGGLGSPVSTDVRTRALAIATHDRIVRAILGTMRVRVADAVEWSNGDAPIGASLTFRLPRPVTVDADLPQADIPPDAPTKGKCVRPYRQTWLHERAKGVTQLFVLIDLKRSRVADITTNASRGTLSGIQGKPYPDCSEIPSG